MNSLKHLKNVISLKILTMRLSQSFFFDILKIISETSESVLIETILKNYKEYKYF